MTDYLKAVVTELFNLLEEKVQRPILKVALHALEPLALMLVDLLAERLSAKGVKPPAA